MRVINNSLSSYSSSWYWANSLHTAKTVSVSADRYMFLTPPNIQISVGGMSFNLLSQATLDLSVAATWDTTSGTDYTVAANRAGKDFYIYYCQLVSSPIPVIKVSASATTPTGYNASTSRKVGGFHCLCVSMSAPGTWQSNHAYVRGNTIASGNYWYYCNYPGTSTNGSQPTMGTVINGTTFDGADVKWVCELPHLLNGYVAGDILPMSVWDLNHRAEAENEGMVYSPKLSLWIDIYIINGTGTTTTSLNGATIKDNTSRLNFQEYAALAKKRLLWDFEYSEAALGANNPTNISGGADPVTTTGHTDTGGRRMVSSIGCEDLVSVQYQATCESTSNNEGSDSWTWKTNTGSRGKTYSQATSYGHMSMMAGGYWNAAPAGGRTNRNINRQAWYSTTSYTARFCSKKRGSGATMQGKIKCYRTKHDVNVGLEIQHNDTIADLTQLYNNRMIWGNTTLITGEGVNDDTHRTIEMQDEETNEMGTYQQELVVDEHAYIYNVLGYTDEEILAVIGID